MNSLPKRTTKPVRASTTARLRRRRKPVKRTSKTWRKKPKSITRAFQFFTAIWSILTFGKGKAMNRRRRKRKTKSARASATATLKRRRKPVKRPRKAWRKPEKVIAGAYNLVMAILSVLAVIVRRQQP
jgi:hypothetical protein